MARTSWTSRRKADERPRSIGTSKRDANYARLFMLAVDTSKQRGGIGRQVLAKNFLDIEAKG
jgi:uncharacterized protein (DUF2384 family)